MTLPTLWSTPYQLLGCEILQVKLCKKKTTVLKCVEYIYIYIEYIGVNPKIGGWKTPKMDGENHGSKAYEQMDDLGGFTPIIFI